MWKDEGGTEVGGVGVDGSIVGKAGVLVEILQGKSPLHYVMTGADSSSRKCCFAQNVFWSNERSTNTNSCRF